MKNNKTKAANANIVYRDKNWIRSNFVISNLVHLINNIVFAMTHSYLCHKATKMLELSRLIMQYLIFHTKHPIFNI